MKKKWLLTLLGCHLCALGQSPPIKKLYVFGDSYSDGGRGWLNSNGPTAIAITAQRLGLQLVPSNAENVSGKSLNFAVSGATTGTNPGHAVTTAFIGFGMQNQVQEFLTMLHDGRTSFNPKTTVFFLAGGLNDRRFSTEQFLADMQGMIQMLYDAGGRRFRIANLPESIMAFADVGQRLNPAILSLPELERSRLPQIEISVTQWGHDFDIVFANAAQYGFTDTVNSCSGRAPFGEDATVCSSPDTHFFFHKNHPSAVVAVIVGGMMFEEWTEKSR